jgi:hypothetical protein
MNMIGRAEIAAAIASILFTISIAISQNQASPIVEEGERSAKAHSIEVQDGSEDSFQVKARVLSESFRIGVGEIHFNFRKADTFKTDADLLQLSVVVSQKSGWFFTTMEHYPLANVIQKGVVWKRNLNIGSPSTAAPVSPGPAEIKIYLWLEKSIPPTLPGETLGAQLASPKTVIKMSPIMVQIVSLQSAF